jgi:hypothetical protein
MTPASQQGPARIRRIFRPWVVVMFAVAAIGMAWFMGAFDREPRYQDLSASDWFSQTDGSSAASLERAAAAFKAMGPRGPLFLASRVTDSKYALAKKWADFRQRHSLPDWTQRFFPWPEDEDENRHVAAELLRRLGPDAAPAFPALWGIFQREEARYGDEKEITVALQSMGAILEQVVPQLIADLNDSNRANRDDCITLLAALGPKAKPAIGSLLNATKQEGWLGYSAAVALWSIDRETNVIVDVF